MTFNRPDGREFDEMRPIEAKAGIIARADGSGYFKIGDTIALAAVYGPRDLYPKFMQDPTKGVLRVKYNMMPFSGSGDRVRPGASRRSREISFVTERALLSAVNLEDFPNAVVDVFIELPQTDAGTRCAGICAASIALADAGISMKDMVAAVSCGKVGDTLLVDLSYAEEAVEDLPVADMPVSFLPRSGKAVLLQMDGQITKDEILRALEMGKEACEKIYDIQKNALKEKFLKGEQDA
ncbi:MAG: exosome complex exonuclease Rrp41 [Nanoarchaeota archaeon]